MRIIRSNKAQSIGANKLAVGELTRTTSAHARALTSMGIASYATPAEIKAAADAKAEREGRSKAKK